MNINKNFITLWITLLILVLVFGAIPINVGFAEETLEGELNQLNPTTVESVYGDIDSNQPVDLETDIIGDDQYNGALENENGVELHEDSSFTGESYEAAEIPMPIIELQSPALDGITHDQEVSVKGYIINYLGGIHPDYYYELTLQFNGDTEQITIDPETGSFGVSTEIIKILKEGNNDFWLELTYMQYGIPGNNVISGNITYIPPVIPTPWNIETIDGSIDDAGEYGDMVLDSMNRLHISCYDRTNGDLKYGIQKTDGWHISTIDSPGDVGMYTSIALDSGNHPHIVYYDNTNSSLKYIYHSASGWTDEIIDNGLTLGQWADEATTIAIDDSGTPHVAYYDGTSGSLKYAYKDTTGWQIETIDGSGDNEDVGEYPSLALDADGNIHISYYDKTNGYLKYAYKDTYDWQIEIVDDTDWVGWSSDLTLDSHGNPHISHHSCTTGELKYAYRDSAGWHKETVDDQSLVDSSTSIVLDSSGTPIISYYDYQDSKLKYAYKTTYGWNIEAIGDIGGGSTTVLLLDSDDNPQVIYYDSETTALKYAYKNRGEIETPFGDMDGNGFVDRMDLNAIAQSYGTDDTQKDINKDGIVDIYDLAIVAKQIK